MNREQLLEEIARLRTELANLESAQAGLERYQALLRKSEEAERQFSERLAALVEVVNELAGSSSVDELCRWGVELARSRLGFERLGILFRTEDPNVFVGSFGVDENGNITDERFRRTWIDPQTPESRILVSREPVVFWGNSPLVDSQGKVVGHGERVLAPIWDGKTVIGHTSMDNRLSREPITKHQVELLRLFSSSLGYLITRKRAECDQERLIEELQRALARIKTLRGLIPICASCKKIRDDQGYWSQVEEYFQAHADAEFTHSICPQCTKRLYPEFAHPDSTDEDTNEGVESN